MSTRLGACLAYDSVLLVKVQVGAFNQKKILVGAFSVIVKTDGSFAALVLIQVCGAMFLLVRDKTSTVHPSPARWSGRGYFNHFT